MRRTVATSALIVLLPALVGAPGVADDRRGGEIGVVGGLWVPDETMTGTGGSIDPELGIRGGSVFTSHWGWFFDGLYSRSGTENGLGDARTVIGRSGVDYLFAPERNRRWLVSLAAGWMVVDFENASFEDFHNPLASIGFGQRMRLPGNWRLRWELRVDHTLDHARLEDNLVQGHGLVAFTWGPGTPERAAGRGSGWGDDDADGVRDRRDLCPDTPLGAVVDTSGCPLDGDRDGVPDGIDRCPRTKVAESVGPDGCAADGDQDGVPDMSDVCTDTPIGAQVDEWGCPEDSDADSIYDGLDDCPDTPRGARVDARGCPSDSDGDGVLDGRDRCPETPAGAPVDSRGCMLDGDGDGVHDDIDQCPDTAPGTTVVDARGCALPPPGKPSD